MRVISSPKRDRIGFASASSTTSPAESNPLGTPVFAIEILPAGRCPPPASARQVTSRDQGSPRMYRGALAEGGLRLPVGASALELAHGRRARVHAELLEDPRHVPFDG